MMRGRLKDTFYSQSFYMQSFYLHVSSMAEAVDRQNLSSREQEVPSFQAQKQYISFEVGKADPLANPSPDHRN